MHPPPLVFLLTRLHSRTERSGTSLLLRMPTHPAGDFKHFLVLNIQQQVNFPTSGHLRHFLVPNISPECTKMNEERLICKLDKYAFLTQIYPLLEIWFMNPISFHICKGTLQSFCHIAICLGNDVHSREKLLPHAISLTGRINNSILPYTLEPKPLWCPITIFWSCVNHFPQNKIWQGETLGNVFGHVTRANMYSDGTSG